MFKYASASPQRYLRPLSLAPPSSFHPPRPTWLVKLWKLWLPSKWARMRLRASSLNTHTDNEGGGHIGARGWVQLVNVWRGTRMLLRASGLEHTQAIKERCEVCGGRCAA